MISIGIEKSQGLVYEGSIGLGRGVWPTPIITPAKIISENEGKLVAESATNAFGFRFREDYFDPISRIRRGRFYFGQGMQPQSWYVQPHPSMPMEGQLPANTLQKSLETFQGWSIWNQISDSRNQQLVLLGMDDRFTVWRVINIEAISTGEDLVTLKARSGFGILPKINDDKVPKAFRELVEESLNGFLDEVHRSAPVSIIDRARDAASQILLAYFNLTGKDAKDLGDLARKLEDELKMVVASSAAKIIARLHARAKPVERHKQELRPIREQDAELATQCVGVILCEIGWANWQ